MSDAVGDHGAVSAHWFAAPTMRGTRVVLSALAVSHLDGWLAAADADEVFTHTSWDRPVDRAAAAAQVDAALSTPGRVPFAQLDARTGELLGSTSYYEIDPANRSLAIGSTWLARRAQRTGVNREAKALLLARAFGRRPRPKPGRRASLAPRGTHVRVCAAARETLNRLDGIELVDIAEITTDKNVPPADVQFVDVGGDGGADSVRTGWTGVTHIWLNPLNPPCASKPLSS